MTDYIKRLNNNETVLDFATHMTKRQEMLRVMIRGLKVCEVHKKEHFSDRFGVEMETVFADEVNSLVEQGLITNDSHKIALTKEGQVYSSNVFEKFYTEDDLREPDEGEVQFGIPDWFYVRPPNRSPCSKSVARDYSAKFWNTRSLGDCALSLCQ